MKIGFIGLGKMGRHMACLLYTSFGDGSRGRDARGSVNGGHHPVSYTHLDVYKRQSQTFPPVRPMSKARRKERRKR